MLFLIIFQAKKKIFENRTTFGFLWKKKEKSKNGPIFLFNTAIESSEYTDFKNVENFEKNKN